MKKRNVGRDTHVWPAILFLSCIIGGLFLGIGIGINLDDSRHCTSETYSKWGAFLGPVIALVFFGLPIYFGWRRKEEEELYRQYPQMRPRSRSRK